MPYYVIGLGNPGKEYEKTRHNVGRMVLEYFREENGFPEWKVDRKARALVSSGKAGGKPVRLFLPETYMNKSGAVLSALSFPARKTDALVVVRDDLDMPLSALKIVFGRGSGGHKGVESVVRAVRTKDFTQLKVGISPETPKGKIRKPKKGEPVVDFIIAPLPPAKLRALRRGAKRAAEALGVFLEEGRADAMNRFN